APVTSSRVAGMLFSFVAVVQLRPNQQPEGAGVDAAAGCLSDGAGCLVLLAALFAHLAPSDKDCLYCLATSCVSLKRKVPSSLSDGGCAIWFRVAVTDS